MLKDWKKPETVEAWSKSVGDYGDIFQMTITNPFVLGAVKALAKGEEYKPEQEYHQTLSSQCTTVGDDYDCTSLSRWHEQKESPSLLNGLRILDLGAGEGYIGRWLAAMGADYSCIDGSDELLKIAKERAEKKSVVIKTFAHDLEAKHPLPEHLESAEYYPDVVLCLALLDHLRDPKPILSSLSKWLGDDSTYAHTPVLCVTLNPDFFFGAEQWMENEDNGSARVARLGPAQCDVEIIPRSWIRYETIFSDCGFHVKWCHPSLLYQRPVKLQEQYLHQAGLEHHPIGGPFVLWVLIPDRVGKATDVDALKKMKLSSLSELGQDCWDLFRDGNLRRKKYEPDEVVLYSNTLGRGAHVVEKGTMHLHRPGGELQQTFKEGEMIGELESCNNPFVGRYIYDVKAGEDGATIVHIPRDMFAQLLGRASDELSAQLFHTLRDRVATTTWIYHNIKRPAEHFPDSLTSTPGQMELLSRALLFVATCERDKHVPTDGLTILTYLDELDGLVSGGQRKGETIKFKDALDDLVNLGVIDAFPGHSRKHHPNEKAELKSLWKRTAESAVSSFLPASPDLASAIYLQNTNEGGWKLLYDSESSSLDRLKLGAKPLAEAEAEKAVFLQGNSSEQDYWRCICNLTFAQKAFFRNGNCTVVHINDMHFLRRIACTAVDWTSEFAIRYENLTEQRKKSHSLQAIEQSRFISFADRAHRFFQAHWSKKENISLSTDKFHGLRGAVTSLLDDFSAD